MAHWKVSPYFKKSCEEHEQYFKDDQMIVRKTCYRGASFFVETNDDNPPEFEFDFVPGGDGRKDKSNQLLNFCPACQHKSQAFPPSVRKMEFV